MAQSDLGSAWPADPELGGQWSIVDGIVFTPFNKESMHLGGNDLTDEPGFARDFFGIDTVASEFHVANGMWTGGSPAMWQ